MSPGRPAYHDELLAAQLRAAFPELAPDDVDWLRGRLEWVDIDGGQTLMTQGEPGDAMYLLVSGRLRTSIRHDGGPERVVREISRGQVVGEMSLFTDEPRSATLVAIRDSVLVRLDRPAFVELLGRSAQASMALTRQVIHRLQTEGARSVRDRPVTIGLLTISGGVDAPDFAQRLASPMRRHWRVAVVDAARVRAEPATAAHSRRDASDADANRRVAVWLDEIEATHDVVLLVADAGPTAWTERCIRHCDELLLLANADAEPALHPVERDCLLPRSPGTGAAQVLVLLHPPDRVAPRGTRAWLGRRPVADHLHVRPTLARDMARLARLQARTATGLVLAGGGARGLAHLGVARALQERGIDVDVIGGTSIGSVMAACLAADRPLDAVMATARRAFGANPTGDYSWLPMVSLIKGKRLRAVMDQALEELVGREADAEDLWKGWFCIATNYSQAREELLNTGPLRQALMASTAIPGALPPVIRNGELLSDGGTFNNFPVDAMRGWRGVGTVIGVDLSARQFHPLPHDDMPGTWALLRDRLRPRHRRRYHVPTLPSFLVNMTILYSLSRQAQSRALTDLYFNPPLPRVGLLDWRRFDDIVQLGYEHACQVLDGVAPLGRTVDKLDTGAPVPVPDLRPQV